jgi:hypothetical protein
MRAVLIDLAPPTNVHDPEGSFPQVQKNFAEKIGSIASRR